MALTGINPLWSPEPPKPERVWEKTLAAAPIVAWRVWAVIESPAQIERYEIAAMADAFDRNENPFRKLLAPRLSAIGMHGTWAAPHFSAKCKATDYESFFLQTYGRAAKPKHDAPATNCHCGIWALKELEDAEKTIAEYDKGQAFAYGSVQLWGRVIECERGYRAQHARPLSLTVINRGNLDVAALSAFYDAEVRVADSLPATAVVHKKHLAQEAKRRSEEYYANQLQLMSSVSRPTPQNYAQLVNWAIDPAKIEIPSPKKRRGWFFK